MLVRRGALITAGESPALLNREEQEAQSKGGAERRGLEQPSARQPVRNTSEHDSARQVGETTSAARSQVRHERNQWDSPSTEKGRCWGLSGGWWWNGGRRDERVTRESCLG